MWSGPSCSPLTVSPAASPSHDGSFLLPTAQTNELRFLLGSLLPLISFGQCVFAFKMHPSHFCPPSTLPSRSEAPANVSLQEFGRSFPIGLPCAVCAPVSSLDFPLLPSALCSPFSHSYGRNYFKRQTRTCLSSIQTLASALYSEQSQGPALASPRDLRCVPCPPTPLLPGLVCAALFLLPSAQGSLWPCPA